MPLLFAALIAALSAALPAAASERRMSPVVLAVKEVSPSVVNISAKSVSRVNMNPFRSGDEMLDRFFQDFFQPVEREHNTLGSGVIVDGGKGLIVTNNHVVEGAQSIRVQLSDRRSFPAKVLGADPGSDLAVLKVESREPLPQARLAARDDLMIGESVIAIGNPFGLQHTVTVGVVSALNRRVPLDQHSSLSGLVQTDASINPGNSGGPLVNLDGEVAGINTAIIQRAQGIGFAIPVSRLKRVVEGITRDGRVLPVWLGLELQDMDPRLAEHFGLDQSTGTVIVDVDRDGPASRAGLSRGQVLLSLDRHPLEDVSHYEAVLSSLLPGQAVDVLVLEQGRERTIRVTPRTFPLERAPDLAWKRLGIGVSLPDRATVRRYGLEGGEALMISRVRPNSRAEHVGLRRGDLLLALGGESVPSPEAFHLLAVRFRHEGKIDAVVQRGRTQSRIMLGD